jgi:hypothetical protein
MSHFTVLVISREGENVKEQLAPFQENNMGDCPQEYMEFEDKTEEYEQEWKHGKCSEFHCSSSCSWGQSVSKENYALIKNGKVGDKITLTLKKSDKGGLGGSGYFRSNEYYRCYAVSEKHEAPTEHIWVKVNKVVATDHPDKNVCFTGEVEVTIVKAPKKVTFKKRYGTYEKYLKDWHGVDGKDEKTGRYGYWSNPNAKWDWFQVGGRWAGFFKLKAGKSGKMGEKSWCNKDEEIPKDRADQAIKKDIDFDAMRQENFEKSSKRYDDFEALMKTDAMKTDAKRARQEAYFTFGVENTNNGDDFVPETREQYLNRLANPTTFAVLKDGKWYERGSMGWWGIVSDKKNPDQWNEEFYKLIDELPSDTLLTVVDAHI